MPHYETDGSCCCEPSGCCPTPDNLTYGCDECTHEYTITMPSVFDKECVCWDGFVMHATQDYDPLDDRYYCYWAIFDGNPVPGCPAGIEAIGGDIQCDQNTCEWVLTIFIGTQGLYPCTELLIEARMPQLTGCPPTGNWPITFWDWNSDDGSRPECDPCTEIDLTGVTISVT